MEVTTVKNKEVLSDVLKWQSSLSALKHDPFRSLRKESREYFDATGIPTTRHEEWKYTNVLPAISNVERIAADTDVKPGTINGLNTADGIVVTMVNGFIAEMPTVLPEGLIIKSISDSVNDPRFAKHFDRYTDKKEDAFAALNGIFIQDGIYLEVLPGKKIEKPVYIIHHALPAGNEMCNPRTLIVSGKHSEAVVEWISVSSVKAGKSMFMNIVHEIAVEENAKLDFCILQNDQDQLSQVCNTYTWQDQHARLNVNTITLGGALVKNKLHLMLDGQNIETHLFGLYMGSQNQHIDNHTAVFHAKPNCFSNQLYKGIMDDSSQGVFNGKIFVLQDAQKTNAFQSSKNVLLSDNASIYAKPQLEVFADDVKCSHGATTGQIDDEALFYLRSRGIGIDNARALLNMAFAADVIQNIPNEQLREYILNLVQQKLVKEQ